MNKYYPEDRWRGVQLIILLPSPIKEKYSWGDKVRVEITKGVIKRKKKK